MKTLTTQYRKRDIARAFGLALRAARVERGISQDKLSEICDLDRTYPSLLERGLRGPTMSMLFRLANALSMEPALLFNETAERLREQ